MHEKQRIASVRTPCVVDHHEHIHCCFGADGLRYTVLIQLSVDGGSIRMKNIMISLVRDEQGQDLIEYALLAGLIAVICVGAVTLAGSKVSALFSQVANSLP